MRDVSIKNVIKDKTLEAKALTLKLDNTAMEISGVANVEELPISLVWNENFEAKDYQRSQQLTMFLSYRTTVFAATTTPD